MSSWGRRLYENDTALDVRDMIDDIFDKYTGDDAIEVLLSRIAAEYTDEDDRIVALLVAADRVLKRGTIDIAALYNDIANDGAVLSQETIDALMELMRSKEHRKKRRAKQQQPDTTWREGDVFIYNVQPDYAQLPEFSDHVIGFICIGHYKYRVRHPIAYAFCIEKTAYEAAPGVEDIIRGARFWRVCNWGELGYAYRVMLWADKGIAVSEDRFQHIGNTNVRPFIADEFKINDPASLPSFLWNEIEAGLLRTRNLMQ